MKLVYAIVQNDDSKRLLRELTNHRISVTRISSTGGFLHNGNSTLMIGVEADRLHAAMLSHTGNCIIPSGYRKDTIREEVIEELGRSSFSGGKRSVLLLNAHEIDPATQNVLLKTIEEPPDGVLFLLTGNDAGILPTILSRCATVLCGLPMYDDIALPRMMLCASPGWAEQCSAH